MKQITRRKYVTTKYYQRCFWFVGHEGDWGICLDCDSDGTVDESRQDRLAQCLTGVVDGRAVVDGGIKSWEQQHAEPAVWQCCRQHFVCQGFTSECPDCGALYNSGGQRLSNPDTWGEETGEHPADIMRIQ